MDRSALTTLRAWTARQWWTAAVASAAVALAVGVPTDVIPNPVFGRPVPVTWWSYPVLVVTAVMGGLLIATYVRTLSSGDPDSRAERQARTGGVAGMLSFFAVGCPVCNKLVLVAFGTAGARQWFEPFQPVLAVASLVLLSYALMTRLATAGDCPLGAEASAVPGGRTNNG